MDIKEIQNAFSKCEVFKGLDPALVGLLIMTGNPASHAEGESIYSKGDPAGGTFALVVSGKVSAVAQSGFAVNELGVGEIIGEVGTISQQGQRTITLKAMEPTRILKWNMGEIREKSPELLAKLKDLAWKRIKTCCE